MAKSLRSKVKRRFRAIKRQSVFAPVESARAQRLAVKQVQAPGLQQQTRSTSIEKEEPQEQSPPQHITEDLTPGVTKDLTSEEKAMIIDTDVPKVSTSGPRNSRHQQWKRKKFAGKKKRNILVHF